MRILILIPQFIKYCRIMYDYIFQKDRSVFIPIGIKRIRQYSVQLYCRILRTRQSACFIWYSRCPYDNSPNGKPFHYMPPVKATCNTPAVMYSTVVITGQANIQIHFFPIAFLASWFFRSVRNKEKQIIKDTMPIGLIIQP